MPNAAEQFVFQISRRSFLSLWSYANPLNASVKKELCDVLVVCDPDVIIISVKDVALADSGNLSTDYARWSRRAIQNSVKQVYGAERHLYSATTVIRSDGSPGVTLPKLSSRRVHRIAVALGAKGQAPIEYGDFGKGFVHVFDEVSFQVVLRELDTISDFVNYLIAKEQLLTSGAHVVAEGGEENLLAWYLSKGRTFKVAADAILVSGGLWTEFTGRAEYAAKRTANTPSYIWDRLIEVWCRDTLAGNLEFGSSFTNAERSIRVMAREDRFARRILGKAFSEFLQLASRNEVRARMTVSPSGVVYVFLAYPHGTDRSFRVAELGNRCFVARGLHRNSCRVVGIATEQYSPGKGFSLDLVYIEKPSWSDRDQRHLEALQKNLGYFTAPRIEREAEDEYPVPDTNSRSASRH